MLNHITSILTSGALWSVVITILAYVPSINKIVEAHLQAKKATTRNAHELTLMRTADRIIPQVLSIAHASKQDRLNRAVDLLAQYADKRGIHTNHQQLINLVHNAVANYKKDGGNVAKTVTDTVESVY